MLFLSPWGLSAHLSKIGVQLTDSPYVVVNMSIMTGLEKRSLMLLGDDGEFVQCLHSVGAPLNEGEKCQLALCTYGAKIY